MATKDWRKIILKRNSVSGEDILFVHRTKDKVLRIFTAFDNTYAVFGKNLGVNESFKLKRQALAFAKAYMRKH